MNIKSMIFLMLFPGIAGCRAQDLATVPAVDLQKYAGKWYDISHLPARFMQGCACTSAEYEVTGKGYVKVTNTCRKGNTGVNTGAAGSGSGIGGAGTTGANGGQGTTLLTTSGGAAGANASDNGGSVTTGGATLNAAGTAGQLAASGGKSATAGASGMGPGVAGNAPGVGGNVPGVGGNVPGVGGNVPGVGGNAPGVGGAGNAGTPSQGGTAPLVGGAAGMPTAGTAGAGSNPGCGDGALSATEGCDDGNVLPFDGCSADCELEPVCSGGSCTTRCGDGIALGEACDDGNRRNGDGCSSSCTVESGYVCPVPSSVGTLKIPAIFRDFSYEHSDFEHSGASGLETALLGMVESQLDADGKPVYVATASKSYVASKDSFAEWYRNVAGTNHPNGSHLTLWFAGDDTYVNRW